MLFLNADEVKRVFVSKGEDFQYFVGDLIRAEITRTGQDHSRALTHQPPNRGDKGVDGLATNLDLGKLHSGLKRKTVWQCKATSKITPTFIKSECFKKEYLEAELGKRLKAGYQYVLCTTDNPVPADLDEIKHELSAQITNAGGINGFLVINAEDLAQATMRYFGLNLKHFGSCFSTENLMPPSYKREYYVEPPSFIWDDNRNRIRASIDEFVNPLRVPAQNGYYVTGSIGVGKTRLLCECLGIVDKSFSSGSYSDFALYAGDTTALEKLFYYIQQNKPLIPKDSFCIIIADEADFSIAARFSDFLNSQRQWLRIIFVVSLSDKDIQFYTGSVHHVMQLGEEAIIEILKEVQPGLDGAQQAEIYRQSDGYVEMALSDASDGTRIPDHITRIRNRVGEEHFRAMQVLSLFTKVGFKEDVAEELVSLSKLPELNGFHLQKLITSKQRPSFIKCIGRYVHLGPESLARRLHEITWSELISGKLFSVQRTLSPSLFDSLVTRVKSIGSETANKELISFFESQFSEVDIGALTSSEGVETICAFIRMNPEKSIPRLRAFIETALPDRLVNDGEARPGKFPPRVYLVDLLDECLSYATLFEDAERCMRQLALGEANPELGNNATNSWMMLWRPRLSGTEVPFDLRFKLWKSLAHKENEDVAIRRMAISAAIKALGDYHHMGKFIRETSFGRPHPEDWTPATQEEAQSTKELQREMARSLLAIALDDTDELGDEVLSSLVSKVEPMLGMEYLDLVEFRSITNKVKGSWSLEIKLARELNSILRRAKAENQSKVIDAIKPWMDDLFDGSLRSKVIDLLGEESWYHHDKEEASLNAKLSSLAKELLASPAVFSLELELLCSEYAVGDVLELGKHLGKLDLEMKWLKDIHDATVRYGHPFLLRGYCLSLAETDDGKAKIKKLLGSTTEETLKTNFDIAMVLGVDVDGPFYIARLLANGHIDARWLTGFGAYSAIGHKKGTQATLRIIVTALHQISESDPHAILAAIEAFAAFQSVGEGSITDADLIECLQRACEAYIKYSDEYSDSASHQWGELVLGQSDFPEWQAKTLVQGITDGGHYVKKVAAQSIQTGQMLPDAAILTALREVMESDDGAPYLLFSELEPVIRRFKSDDFVGWARDLSETSLIALARNLPRPSEEGELAPVSVAFIKEFAGNHSVGNEIVCGWRSHGGVFISEDTYLNLAKPYEVLLDHPEPLVADIAMQVVKGYRAEAEYWKQRFEERKLE